MIYVRNIAGMDFVLKPHIEQLGWNSYQNKFFAVLKHKVQNYRGKALSTMSIFEPIETQINIDIVFTEEDEKLFPMSSADIKELIRSYYILE